MNFEPAFKIIYGEEGGYANEPTDTGGETYRGISRVHNPSWPGWAVIDREKARRGGRIPRYTIIPEAEPYAKSYLKTKYWDYPKIERYPAALRLLLFDTYVNAGFNAFGILARALGIPWKAGYVHQVGGKPIIRYDAKGNTAFWNDDYFIANAPKVSPEAYTEARKTYYRAIGKGGNAVNLPGWLSRSERVLQEAKKFITENPGLTAGAVVFFLAAGYVGYKLISKK